MSFLKRLCVFLTKSSSESPSLILQVLSSSLVLQNYSRPHVGVVPLPALLCVPVLGPSFLDYPQPWCYFLIAHFDVICFPELLLGSG